MGASATGVSPGDADRHVVVVVAVAGAVLRVEG
jgi:hypothetical protein